MPAIDRRRFLHNSAALAASLSAFEVASSRSFAEEPPAQPSKEAKKMATEPLGPAPAGSDLPDLAAWTVVANVLLNLDETLMRR